MGLVVGAIQVALQLPGAGAIFKLDVEWIQRHSMLVSSLALLALIFVLFIAFRVWLRESQEPFRYTCSVAEFEVVPPVPNSSFEIGSYLRYDLTERMNQRIARLSFLADDAIRAEARDGRSHIHVSGQLLVRPNARGEWMVEATPRIRMGSETSPERLGHPVKFKLGTVSPTAGKVKRYVTVNGSERTLVPAEYEKVLERIYFSISSELYKQIRLDVETKIRLLPTRRFRAIAYLHEAEDYLQSNTLDAYEEARSLFDASLDLFDPRQRRAHRPLYFHWFRALSIGWSIAGHTVRQIISRAFPRFGKDEILTARAEVGFAISVVDRRVLAGLSGHRMNAIFPARPAVERALVRLARTSPRTLGSTDVRFRALVTKALTAHYLGDVSSTEAALQQARAVDPGRTETDARFLFAAGLHEVRPRWALPYLRRAVEQDPRLEIAQFEFALKMEYAWRMRSGLEHGIAESIVVTEYEDVLKINPGNIRAWANLGYVYWLLGPDHHAQAEEAYWRGREYKEMRRTTQVAELDHGLARLYAEAGDFSAAFFHCLRAVSGRLSLGLDHGSETSAQFYFFDFIGPAMLHRFDNFLETVEEHAKNAALLEKQGITERVRDAVVSFALNDCGEAYRDYYSRAGVAQDLDTARKSFDRAISCNPQAVMPRFNKYLLESHEITRGTLDTSSSEAAARGLLTLTEAHRGVRGLVRQVSHLEHGWADAECARMLGCARVVERVRREVHLLRASGGEEDRPYLHGLETSLIALAKTAAAEIEGDVSDLRRLAPHEWLWDKDDFNWSSLRSQYVKDGRWEREVDDLHVRALFAWAAAHMVPESGHTLDPGWLQRRRNEKLLTHLRDTYWAGDFLLLRLCGHMRESPVDPSELKDVIQTWLKEDPSAWWSLETALTEKWREDDLFSKTEKCGFLAEAKTAPDASPSLLRWIEGREAELGGCPDRPDEDLEVVINLVEEDAIGDGATPPR